ncbi:MAG: carbon-nitrogen hydrolase family protein [Myxococcota bacterium]
MRVGVVQLTSTDDVASNLAAAEKGVREAAAQGAGFVALPEMFAFLRREGGALPVAQGLDGPIVAAARSWARDLGVRLLAGSFAERVPGEDRVYNTSVLISPAGEIEASYRKIHLFDVDLEDAGGGAYRESARIAPGDQVVVADTPLGGVGLSVCYDLRFPELYRQMAARGAVVLTVPSAFTRETGKDHWEVLLRARAIENQAFVVAPAQCGRHSPDRASHGRSLIVDPWGLVLAQLGDRPGVAVAECDLEELARVRRRLPALSHRRL